MNPTLYILLPVHNRREITLNFVRCLKAQSYPDFHLVLLDDGCSDGTAEAVRGELPAVTVIRGEGNWWWAGSLQQGYLWLKTREVAATDLVLVMNDDTEFEPDFLQKGVDLMQGRERALYAAFCYSRHTKELVDGGFKVDWRRLRFDQAEHDGEVGCFSSTAIFLRCADFLASGGFYPRLLPHYLSDLEFTLRAARNGIALRRDPSLKLLWDEETTGFREFGHETVRGFLGRYFSRKSSSNPFAWSAFVLMASPWPWKITGVLRVWAAAAIAFAQAAANSARLKKQN